MTIAQQMADFVFDLKRSDVPITSSAPPAGIWPTLLLALWAHIERNLYALSETTRLRRAAGAHRRSWDRRSARLPPWRPS